MSNNPPEPMSIRNVRDSDVQQPQSSVNPSATGTPAAQRYGTPPVANIPPRMFGSPRPPSTVPNYGSVPQRPLFNPASGSGSGTATPVVNAADAEEAERARVLRRHLVSAEERTDASRRPSAGGLSLARPAFLARRPSSDAASANPTPGPAEPFPLPYGSSGGDVT
jgi:proton-coupled amino acid transporter